ncbi:MAG: peptidoglycan editing factor PgeF [Patescibacteria group bacterium]|jgi:hypothetical protein
MEKKQQLQWQIDKVVYWGASLVGDGSMRLGGTDRMGVEQCRRLYFEKVGLSNTGMVAASLVHGASVHVATASDAGKVIADVDALVTRTPQLTLSITFADCLPVYIADSKARVVAVLHAGWRGLAAGVVMATVRACTDLVSSKASELEAYIGPAICAEHYSVGMDVAKTFSHYNGAVRKDKNGGQQLDLINVAKQQLQASGLADSSITSAGICTYETATYFSNRRDKPREIEAQVAYIGLRKQ